MAFLFLILATAVVRFLGVEQTSETATIIFAAGVMAGGVYGIILIASIVIHVVKRLVTRQPIMEIED